MLISSVPPVHQTDLLVEIVTHPRVDAVRYNTGMTSAYSPTEVISRIKRYVRGTKPIFIDLKGKQLRIIEWTKVPDGPILLNHAVSVEGRAKVYFRGDNRAYDLVEVVKGNQIFVDPLPRQMVGRGQAVNIVGAVKILGGLLPLDHEFIKAAVVAQVTGFMLSFVESNDDLSEFNAALRACGVNDLTDYTVILKIESALGLKFIAEASTVVSPYRLMAARDDLMIQIGVLKMLDALKLIIKKDPNAICASRLLLGLEQGEVSMADMSDLEYMRKMGYRSFMFSDGISRDHFTAAVNFWDQYRKAVKL